MTGWSVIVSWHDVPSTLSTSRKHFLFVCMAQRDAFQHFVTAIMAKRSVVRQWLIELSLRRVQLHCISSLFSLSPSMTVCVCVCACSRSLRLWINRQHVGYVTSVTTMTTLYSSLHSAGAWLHCLTIQQQYLHSAVSEVHHKFSQQKSLF